MYSGKAIVRIKIMIPGIGVYHCVPLLTGVRKEYQLLRLKSTRQYAFEFISHIREGLIFLPRGAGNKGSTPKRHSHTPHMFKIYIMYLDAAYPSPKVVWGEPTPSFYL